MTGDSARPTASEPPTAPDAPGVAVIEATLRTLPGLPGVYRMNGADGDALYVGKAKNLRKRVATYARPERLPLRLKQMVDATLSMEIVTTHTEVEALLLESNLIKRLKPRYNVCLRDDKSFPFILLTGDHDFPQLLKHRGARSRKGAYFGPFASAGAVNRTLATLQRAFPLRSCSDHVFASRTRPCLQFQIKRCTAPCVGRIAGADYGAIVADAQDFLSGRSQELQQRLADRMQGASDGLEYEVAAIYRDRIRALAQIQARQDINIAGLGEADVIAAYQDGGHTCIQVFFYRAGQNFGNRTYFPTHARDVEIAEVLEQFIGQFYADKTPPARVLISHALPQQALLAEALAVRAGRAVELAVPVRGTRRKVVDNAILNAREALGRRLAESSAQRRLREGLAELFGLDSAPRRIEVYDNSHIGGTNALGAMIVAGPDGFDKGAYRKFNIKGAEITPGDDYAMMREVLGRRFARALKEDPDRERGQWPDLVLIDGGLGQLNAACEVLAEHGIADLELVAISKGPDRDAGRERFHAPGREPFMLPPNDPVLYFLQRLRDEAHRFAIGAHRARRSAAIGRSPLDEIAGIGDRRKRALLHRFGSADGVAKAGLGDLETVDGISTTVARRIYDYFHGNG
ncbi:MAG: excinuclease ABC subunit UvrC [Alphaproteobacteria bacterium]|nr:excinuclease ABC subunit UvrC [Alphaproteobacteria bacterium]